MASIPEKVSSGFLKNLPKILGVALIFLIMLVLFLSVYRQAILKFLGEHFYQMSTLGLFLTVVYLFNLLRGKKAPRKKAMEVLRQCYTEGQLQYATCNGRPIGFDDLDKSPESIMTAWIEPYAAWLYIGNIMGPSKQYSFMIEEETAEIIRPWEHGVDQRIIDSLTKKGFTYEEAVLKLKGLEQSAEALKKFQETGVVT